MCPFYVLYIPKVSFVGLMVDVQEGHCAIVSKRTMEQYKNNGNRQYKMDLSSYQCNNKSPWYQSMYNFNQEYDRGTLFLQQFWHSIWHSIWLIIDYILHVGRFEM